MSLCSKTREKYRHSLPLQGIPRDGGVQMRPVSEEVKKYRCKIKTRSQKELSLNDCYKCFLEKRNYKHFIQCKERNLEEVK